MNLRDQCPLCASEKNSHFITCKDYTVSNEEFEIVTCDNCSLHYTKNVPAEDKIGRYYDSVKYISHSSTNKGLINKVYQVVRKRSLNKKVQLVKKFIDTGDRLVDVGAGTGHFIKSCGEKNISAEGYEPDNKARQNAEQINGVKLKTLEEFNATSGYSVLTMWHVLEHVYHLKDFIELVKGNLKDEGVWIIAVPNMSSYDAKHYGKYWAAYDVPRHLYHFTPKNIEFICEKHNFNLEQVLPMKYDSFYVSMLSEKYKKGSLVRALWNGLKSNFKAGKNRYSSQIYILRKK